MRPSELYFRGSFMRGMAWDYSISSPRVTSAPFRHSLGRTPGGAVLYFWRDLRVLRRPKSRSEEVSRNPKTDQYTVPPWIS
jgi:hypothetical protein